MIDSQFKPTSELHHNFEKQGNENYVFWPKWLIINTL